MDSMINEEIALIEKNDLKLSNGHGNVRIIRSTFDTKMPHMFSGAVGANCQLCTATFKQIHDLELIGAGFPMNKPIHDARILFDEVDEKEFLAHKPELRFNISYKPTSDKDIVSGSPLHAYFRCFPWFVNLVTHFGCRRKNNGHLLQPLFQSRRSL